VELHALVFPPDFLQHNQKTLPGEPLTKLINPAINWQTLLPHAKAMTTLCKDVQFDRVTCGPPGTIQGNTWIHSQRIIIGKSDKQRRCIGWNSDLFPESTVDRGREIGTTLRIVLKCHTDGNSAPCGEAHDANPVRGYTPLGSTLPYHFDGLLSVGNGQRSNLPGHLPHLV